MATSTLWVRGEQSCYPLVNVFPRCTASRGTVGTCTWLQILPVGKDGAKQIQICVAEDGQGPVVNLRYYIAGQRSSSFSQLSCMYLYFPLCVWPVTRTFNRFGWTAELLAVNYLAIHCIMETELYLGVQHQCLCILEYHTLGMHTWTSIIESHQHIITPLRYKWLRPQYQRVGRFQKRYDSASL